MRSSLIQNARRYGAMKQQISGSACWNSEEGDRLVRASFGEDRAARFAGNAILKRAALIVYDISLKPDGVSLTSIAGVAGAEADVFHLIARCCGARFSRQRRGLGRQALYRSPEKANTQDQAKRTDRQDLPHFCAPKVLNSANSARPW